MIEMARPSGDSTSVRSFTPPTFTLFAFERHQRESLSAFFRETFHPAEIGQVDHEAQLDDLATDLLDEGSRGLGRSAGRDQIVDYQHALAFGDCVHVDLH